MILTDGDPFIVTAARRSPAAGGVRHGVLAYRVPVTDPQRVSDDLVVALHAPGATTYVAVHANHPREFSRPATRAIARLVDGGVVLISQSVLLKGVNDDAQTLAELMRAFVENRIKPYYLHHPDLAPGTSHFRIGIEDGLALMRELRKRISGLAMPTYMLDIPGGFGKVPLESANIEKTAESWRIRDMRGRWHDYHDHRPSP